MAGNRSDPKCLGVPAEADWSPNVSCTSSLYRMSTVGGERESRRGERAPTAEESRAGSGLDGRGLGGRGLDGGLPLAVSRSDGAAAAGAAAAGAAAGAAAPLGAAAEKLPPEKLPPQFSCTAVTMAVYSPSSKSALSGLWSGVPQGVARP